MAQDAQLERTLIQMVMPADNSALNDAENQLKALMCSPECIPLFLNQIQRSSNSAVRQLSAILLRKRIKSFWKSQNAQAKDQMKQILLQQLVQEPERPVQTAIAGIVAVVAKYAVPAGEWNELLQFLLQCFQESSPRLKEIALMLFRVLSDTIGIYLLPHFSVLIEIFHRGITDRDSPVVREESVRGMHALFNHSEEEEHMTVFIGLIPKFVEFIVASCQSGHTSTAVYGLELIREIIEAVSLDYLEQHVALLVNFTCDVAVNPSVDLEIREKANSLLTWIIKFQSIKVMRSGNGELVQKILHAGFNMMTQQYDGEDDEDQIASTVNRPQGFALEVFDEVLIHLPNEMIFEPTLNGAVSLCRSENPFHRSAGMLVIFVMAEGCAEPMRHESKLPHFLDMLCNGMADADPTVRANATLAMIQVAQHCQPEVYLHHKAVIQHLLSMCDDNTATPELLQRLMTAIETYCADLSDDIMTIYADDILKRLGNMLVSTTNNDVILGIVNAVGGIAAAAKQRFLPYFQNFAGILVKIMGSARDENITLRAAATKCMGSIALAVGAQNFQPCLNDVLQMSLEGLKLDSYEIRESTYVMYAHIAEMVGHDFGNFIPYVMDMIFNSMDSNDGLMRQAKGTDIDSEFGNCGGRFDDEIEEDEAGQRYQISILSGYIDEKMSAMQALSSFFKHCGPSMAPYVEKALDSVEKMTEYLHDSVRILGLLLYDDIFAFAAQMWPAAADGSLAPHVQVIVESTFPNLLTSIGLEFEKQVASIAVDVLVRSINVFGVNCLKDHLGLILETVLLVLDGKTPSQQFAPEDATLQEDELDELVESAADLISVIAKSTGPRFSDIFRELCNPMLRCMSQQNVANSAGLHASMIGCFGEVATEIGNNIIPFGDDLFPMILQYMQHPLAIVRRSAAFALGAMFLSGGTNFAKYYNDSLVRLEALYSIPAGCQDEQMFAARDNACSALSKIIHTNSTGEAGLNLGHVFSLFINGLPIVEDFAEAKYVYPCLVNLLGMYKDNLVPQFLPKLVEIFSAALASEHIDQQMKVDMAQCAKMTFASSPQLTEIVNALPPAQRDAISRAMA